MSTTTFMSNRYPGRCGSCGHRVQAGAGRLVKESSGYTVYHFDGECLAAPVPSAAPRREMQVTELGMYQRPDGEVYRVQRSDSGRLYAKHVAIDNSDPEYVRVAFDYERGAVYTLTAEMKMTEAQAKAFGAKWGFCCVCCAELVVPQSVMAGYGPTCAKNNGWHYPTKTEYKAWAADQRQLELDLLEIQYNREMSAACEGESILTAELPSFEQWLDEQEMALS